MWNESQGTNSRAFDEFRLTIRDIKAFLQVGLRLSQQGFRKAYEDAEIEASRRWNERGDNCEPDHPITIATEAMQGLDPSNFEWMHLAGIVRDAITAFEVYLHKGLVEVLRFAGYETEDGDETWNWGELRALYKGILLASIESSELKRLRDLRHLLTHQRGELRSDEQRTLYQSSHVLLFHAVAKLEEVDAQSACELLLSAARAIDPYIWAGAWGPDRSLIQSRVADAIKNDKVVRRLFRPSTT